MYQSFEDMYREFIMDTMVFSDIAWNESPDHSEAEIRKHAVEKRLFNLIPPKKRKKAEFLLEDLDTISGLETVFYYQYGIKIGIRLLKHLGVI